MTGLLFWLLLAAGGAWTTMAIRVQAPQTTWALALPVALVIALAVLRLQGGWAWPALAIAGLGVALWFLSLPPRADRDWAPDVARIIRGTLAEDGRTVTLHDIRSFRWQDRDNATPHWQSQTFDLATLVRADMITSVWSSPEIAHLLISFGFSDGRQLAFSVEIRRERGEKFSSVGGFFRQFELALIAADEEDIVKLRTHHRAEDVRLYPLRLTPPQMQALFLEYVRLGNDLAAHPRWYNTITANCTTVVWQLTRALGYRPRLDPALLLSGRLPGWLHRLGLIDLPGTLAEIRDAARISARAQAVAEGEDFSRAIRAGLPEPTGNPRP